jgi:hypothetical protein
MNLPAKPDKPIDRKALEKIIQRAAELQADQRELGDYMSEDEILALGDDVGIPKHLMRQAMLEVRTTTEHPVVGGVVPWLYGPKQVSANRVIRRDAHEVEQELHHWMKEVELLSVKRRFTDSTSWEPKKDVVSKVKRALGTAGTGYKLARAEEIIGEVARLESDTCHVSLVADISNLRRQRITGSVALTATGGVMTAIGFALGFAEIAALLPIGLGTATGFASTRVRQSEPEKAHVALEQVLDKLQHSEIKLAPAPGRKSDRLDGQRALKQAVDEIKRLPDIISKKLK